MNENAASFCRKCGEKLVPDSRFCHRCGGAVVYSAEEELNSEVQETKQDEKGKRPWYFSKPILVIAFLFFTPIWALLILADKRQGRIEKAFAFIVFVGYITVSAYILQNSTNTNDSTQLPNNTGSTTIRESRSTPTASVVTVDRSNWGLIANNPESYKGTTIEVVGQLSGSPTTYDNTTYWRLWIDPNYFDAYAIIALNKPVSTLKENDYVRVQGTVLGTLKERNVFGANYEVPHILVKRISVVDALSIASPAIRVVTLDESQTQHDVSIAVKKVEFANDETRVFLTVSNESENEALFFAPDSTATQGNLQFDPEVRLTYPEVRSDLLPGMRSEGVIVFPAMDPFKETTLILQAMSYDIFLEFEPYVFQFNR